MTNNRSIFLKDGGNFRWPNTPAKINKLLWWKGQFGRCVSRVEMAVTSYWNYTTNSLCLDFWFYFLKSTNPNESSWRKENVQCFNDFGHVFIAITFLTKCLASLSLVRHTTGRPSSSALSHCSWNRAPSACWMPQVPSSVSFPSILFPSGNKVCFDGLHKH